MQPPSLPFVAELSAPSAWTRIDFISDLHLAADTPQTFDAWARYMRETPAEAVFILGDLAEVWVGDDSRFDGFEARIAEVLTRATQQRAVAFMGGNRDFLLGAEMLEACGVMALADPCVLSAFDQRVLLTHGDALCLSDTDYQKFRAMVRDAAWQRSLLAQPLEARRRYAREVRNQSEMRKQGTHEPASWADVDAAAAITWLREAQAPTLIHGHTHRPATESLAPGFVRHVLSDWDLDHSPDRAEVVRLTRTGLTRLPLQDALHSSP